MRFVIYELYNYFDCRFYQLQPSLSSKSNDTITTFLIELHKLGKLHSLNYEFIFKYLVYQYDYWNDKRIEGFGNHTRIVNIFGPKAYSRYVRILDNPTYSWYNAEKTLKDTYGIDRAFLKNFYPKEVGKELKVHEDEENEKTIFDQNGPVQLLHCLDSTTLYKHTSDICSNCSMKDECLVMLKSTYYRIYKKRGYGNKTSVEQKSKVEHSI